MQSTDYHDLISRCLKKEVAAEYQLYRLFAPRMFGICLRYGNNRADAEEILQIGFVRLFNHLHQFRHEGEFEGWVHRIFVTSAINYYHKHLKFNQHVEIKYAIENTTLQADSVSLLTAKELLAMIQRLPLGFRTVFCLHEIEGYDHEEIGKMLDINTGTSKSQLHHARNMIRKMLKEMEQD